MSTSHGAEEIKRMKSRTDRGRLDAMTDEEITAAAMADPDNPPLSEDFFEKAKQP